MTPEEKRELLKEFLDFIIGVEDLTLCQESNDPESDQEFVVTDKDESDLVGNFLKVHIRLKEGC